MEDLVVAEGNLNKILKNNKSLTAQYLNKKKNVKIPKTRRKFNKNKIFNLQKIKTNNLNNLEVKFPLGNFICVTGVSGSGKSSLIIDTLYKRLDEYFNKSLIKMKVTLILKVLKILIKLLI